MRHCADSDLFSVSWQATSPAASLGAWTSRGQRLEPARGRSERPRYSLIILQGLLDSVYLNSRARSCEYAIYLDGGAVELFADLG
jgi:hypothetical protein